MAGWGAFGRVERCAALSLRCRRHRRAGAASPCPSPSRVAGHVREPRILALLLRGTRAARAARLRPSRARTQSWCCTAWRWGSSAGRPSAPSASTVRAPPPHRGRVALCSSDVEHRGIRDRPNNGMMDPERLPRPVFAHPPHARVLRAQPPSTPAPCGSTAPATALTTWRRARRWEKYRGHPAVAVEGRSWVPAHRAAAMGSILSAGISQGFADVAALGGELPELNRALFGKPAPHGLPRVGSSTGDLWALELCKRARPSVPHAAAGLGRPMRLGLARACRCTQARW